MVQYDVEVRAMPNNIPEIKSLLEQNVGEEVVVTVSLGRNKTRERRGVLKETYRSIFIVDLGGCQNQLARVSYSYKDVLTHAIEVAFV